MEKKNKNPVGKNIGGRLLDTEFDNDFLDMAKSTASKRKK